MLQFDKSSKLFKSQIEISDPKIPSIFCPFLIQTCSQCIVMSLMHYNTSNRRTILDIAKALKIFLKPVVTLLKAF